MEWGEGNGIDEHRTDGVEEDLKSAEEGFAENGVEEEGFESGGKVSVEAVDTEGFMVGEVVGLFSGSGAN